jgi:hypothetical protein
MDVYTLKKMNRIINFYSRVKNRNMYHPSLNNKKTLTVIACHINSELKFKTIIGNINFLNFASNDIIIINSKNLPFNQDIQIFCSNQNIKYIEVENDSALDFGKWVYVLKTENLSEYPFIVLTNDSYIIHKPICYFYNLTVKRDVELYGFNDSTQTNYHYQSYLFSLKKEVINDFINIVESKTPLLNGSSLDVIEKFELKLTEHFSNCDCFLKIGNEDYHKTKNIFFENDIFYGLLMRRGLLPFTKIKRIT